MKYVMVFILIMLLSCGEEGRSDVYIKKSTTAIATVNYSVNTSGAINDEKTFSLKNLIGFLISSSDIRSWTDVGPISIQSISLELSVNGANEASGLAVNTSIAHRNCSGSLSTFTPFSISKNIPLQDPFIGINIPIAVSVSLSPSGVTLLNGTLASNLPWNPFNSWGDSTCGDLIFKLNGNASPSGKLASLNLKVVIRYNVEYGECTDNFFLSAITSSEDRCNF